MKPMDDERAFSQKLTVLPAGEGEIIAEASVPSGSAWYAGHFPGQPILPGVAILGLVAEAIRVQARREGRTMTLDGMNRVRFRLPVGPGERMEMQIQRKRKMGKWAYPFIVMLGGELLCSGIFTGFEKEVRGEQIP